MDQQSLEDCVRQAIPQIRMCAGSHPNKAAKSLLMIWARNLESHLPEVVKAEKELLEKHGPNVLRRDVPEKRNVQPLGWDGRPKPLYE